MPIRDEREQTILEEIESLLTAGVKAKGSEDVVFKQTADGKAQVHVE